jgi:PLP dependent protein
MSIAERLAEVRRTIARTAAAAHRPAPRLVAVSKLQPASALREAYAAGQRDFGENYVQELNEKAEALADLEGICFHLIGHLQRNKVKAALGAASAIHGVDSVRLAQELGRRASLGGGPRRFRPDDARLPVFAEVNVGGEATKSGCAPGELAAVLEAIAGAPTLVAVGLMTVPPHTEDPEAARPYFDALVALRDAHGGAARLPELSMGMTHDLAQAVAAGATIVRVGTAIFGQRPPRSEP